MGLEWTSVLQGVYGLAIPIFLIHCAASLEFLPDSSIDVCVSSVFWHGVFFSFSSFFPFDDTVASFFFSAS